MALESEAIGATDGTGIANLNEALLRIAALEWRQMGAAAPTAFAVEAALGRFEGLPPHVAFLDDGRTVRLLRPLTFFRPDGEEWPVPAGIEVDGASIPRPFWTLMGGPFEGKYRNASIVHDHYCVTRSRPWRSVHRVFYEAMRASGVSALQAKVMHYAVYRFGPRWPEPEIVAGAAAGMVAAAAVASDRDAEGLVRDAEAIYVHDLSLDQIELLADMRNGAAGAAVAMAAAAAALPPALLAWARQLVIPGGSGTAEDVETVASHAAQLPAYVLQRFEDNGVRFLACRNSVTDFETDLRGATPRGWEETGKTWDDVAGAYFHDRRRVVIATRGKGGRRVVPEKPAGSGGSFDLVVHASFHGYDYVGGHAVLEDPRFLDARQVDLWKLGRYEQQEGVAGLEETFAESGAWFVVDPEGMSRRWPGLYAYWTAGPRQMAIEAPAARTEIARPEPPIGTAELLDDGAIALELRAEGPGGGVGHAWFTLFPGDTLYEVVSAQLRAGNDASGTLVRGSSD